MPAPIVITERPADLTSQELIDIDNGKISAVLIDSDFGPLWFAFDDSFVSGDDIPASSKKAGAMRDAEPICIKKKDGLLV
jgi:hypothetical protein